MSALPLKTYNIDELGQFPLESMFRAGECCKIRLGSVLPESIARLTQQALVDEMPNAIARSGVVSSYGHPIRVSELHARYSLGGNAPVVDDDKSSPNVAVLSLFDTSRVIHKELENLSLLSSWKKMAALFWIGGGQPGLHFDGWDNILLQLSGKKHVTIYGPKQTGKMKRVHILAAHQDQGKLSAEGEKSLDYFEGWLEPGEALVIPCGAMHALNGESDSLSLNCFLDGGPRPCYLRYRYLYFAILWWRERLSMLVSHETAVWLEQRFEIKFFTRYQSSMRTVPRTFPHT